MSKKYMLWGLVLAGCLTANALKIETAEDTKIVISNTFGTIILNPEKGGVCEKWEFAGADLVEKKLGKEQLVSVRIMKPKMVQFNGKWEWEIIEHTKDRVTVKMRAEGPFFSEINKYFTVYAAASKVDVKIVLKRKLEGITKGSYTLWLNNLINFTSGFDNFISYDKNGLKIITKDNLHNGGKYHYNPSMNFTGYINREKGVGLFAIIKSEHLDAFYNWFSGKGPATVEWAYRDITLEAGETFSTSFTLLPAEIGKQNVVGNLGDMLICGQIAGGNLDLSFYKGEVAKVQLRILDSDSVKGTFKIMSSPEVSITPESPGKAVIPIQKDNGILKLVSGNNSIMVRYDRTQKQVASIPYTKKIKRIGLTNQPGARRASWMQEVEMDDTILFIARYNDNLDGEDSKGVIPPSTPSDKIRLVDDSRFGKGVDMPGRTALVYPVKGNLDYQRGSIEMWIRPELSEPDKQWRYLFEALGDKKQIKGKNKQCNTILLAKTAYNQLRAGIIDSNGVLHRAYREQIDLKPGQWYHIRMIWDLNKPVYKTNYIDLFINGSNAGNVYGLAHQKINVDFNSQTFTIGKNFKGMIDNVVIRKEPETNIITEERQIDFSVVEPTTPWLKPYAKGPINVLFIVGYSSAGDLAYLYNLLDMQCAVTKFVYAYQTDSVFELKDNHSINSNAMFADRLRLALLKDYDVIVMSPTSFKNHIPKDIQNTIVEKVENGTGLVCVTPHDFKKQPISEILPVENPDRKQKRLPWMKNLDHFISSNIPFDELNEVSTIVYKPNSGRKPVQTASGNLPAIQISDEGKNRVAVICFGGIPFRHMQKFDNMYAQSRLTPGDLYKKGEFAYWTRNRYRYYRLMLAKAILWAAGKVPDVRINALSFNHKTNMISFDVFSEKKDNIKVLFEFLVNAENEKWQKKFTEEMTVKNGKNNVSIRIPFLIPNGRTIIDVRALADSKVLTAGVCSFDVKQPVVLEGLKTDRTVYAQGEDGRITAHLQGNDPVGMKYQITVKDFYGRITYRKDGKITGSDETIDFSTKNALAPFISISVKLLDKNNNIVDIDTLDRILLPEKRDAFDRFKFISWGAGNKNFQLDYGLAAQRFDSTGNIYYCQNGTLPIPHYWKFQGRDKEVKGKKYARVPCLTDPEYLKKTRASLIKQTKRWKKYQTPIYILCDEVRYSPRTFIYWEGCYADSTINAFREWLKKQYADLDALNNQWGTAFKEWGQVYPSSLDEVKGRGDGNYSSWADFREFGDTVFADYVVHCGNSIKEVDPEGRVAMSGTVSPFVSNGFDWWKMANALDAVWNYRGIQRELLRSYQPYCNIVVHPYSAGYGWYGPELFYKMFFSMMNQVNGISSWKSPLFFLPEKTLNHAGRDTKRIVDLFKDGLWDYVRSFKRQKDVAVLYSMSSLRGAFVEGHYKEFTDTIQGWADILHDRCVSWTFISPEQLKEGILQKEKYSTVILPYCISMSEKEIEQLQEFVKAGGKIIIDDHTGTMDQHCKRSAKPFADYFPGKIQKEFPVGKAKMTIWQCGKGMMALAPVNTAEYMLNAKFYKKTVASMQTEMQKLFDGLKIRSFAELTANKKPFHGKAAFYTGCNSKLLIALPDNNITSGQKNNLHIQLPEKYNVYLPLQKRFYGNTSFIKLNVEKGFPAILVLSKYQVKFPKVKMPSGCVRGETVVYSVSAGTEGFVPTYMTVKVKNSKGWMKHYDRAIIISEPGKYRESFTPALNDSPGAWSLEFTNMLTGDKKEVSVKIIKDKSE